MMDADHSAVTDVSLGLAGDHNRPVRVVGPQRAEL